MTSETRYPIVAFLFTAPAAVGFWIVAYLVHAVVVDGPDRAAPLVPYLVIGGAIMGLPIAVAVLLVIATPAYLIARRATTGIPLPAVLVLGAVGGVAARLLVHTLWGQPESSFVPVPVVLAVGLATGAFWWTVWRHRFNSVRGRGTV